MLEISSILVRISRALSVKGAQQISNKAFSPSAGGVLSTYFVRSVSHFPEVVYGKRCQKKMGGQSACGQQVSLIKSKLF